MTVDITKLADAEYYLDGSRDALDDMSSVVTGADPVAYYTAEGNPPGRWIGSGATALGLETGVAASKAEVRSLVNQQRDPKSGRLLGDAHSIIERADDRTVSAWDLTLTLPKSVSLMWAFGDDRTRHAIERCMREATDMAVSYLEDGIVQTRAGAGGVASMRCDGIVGLVFDHCDNRNGDPHLHRHLIVSNRVRRTADGEWTAIDGRLLYSRCVETSDYFDDIMRDLLTRDLGVAWRRKPSRTHAATYEVDGIDDALIDAFSSRDREIEARMEKAVAEREAETGRPLTFRERAVIHRDIWLETRRAKPEVQPSWADKAHAWDEACRQRLPGVDPGEQIRRALDSHAEILSPGTACEETTGTILTDQIRSRSRSDTDDGTDRDVDRKPEDNVLSLLEEEGEDPEELAERAVDALSHRRTVWTVSNVTAEALKLTSGYRVDPYRRKELADAIARHALGRMTRLTDTRYRVPEGAEDDPRIMSTPTRTTFDDPSFDLYTTDDILQAEKAAMSLFDRRETPAFAEGDAGDWLDRWKEETGAHLSDDQRTAAIHVLEDAHTASAIVGPAGTGKTTTMRAVARAWEHAHGKGSVIGMATSARARGELGRSIGCTSMTIARFLTWHEANADLDGTETGLRAVIEEAPASPQAGEARRRLATAAARSDTYELRPGQLVIVDEAGMVDTRQLARIGALCERAGAHMVLTGDPRQLDAVSGAGGLLGWAEREGRAARLESLWRFAGATADIDPQGFRDRWARDDADVARRRMWKDEGQATLRLRQGFDPKDPKGEREAGELADEYRAHDRLHGGEDADLEDMALDMCRTWQHEGKTTLMIAGTNAQVRDLNERTILELRAAGLCDAGEGPLAPLSDGLTVGAGNQIVARRNDRTIRDRTGTRSVENNMTFRIDRVGRHSLECTNLEDGSGWSLPLSYAAADCEAGYATTVHRSQGMTVDRAVAIFPTDAHAPLNLLYVAATRGREENHLLYGCGDAERRHRDMLRTGSSEDPQDLARTRMIRSLTSPPGGLTAIETRRREQDERLGLRRLLAEHDYAAGMVSGPHLEAMLARTHDARDVARIVRSPGWEWLRGVWSRAYMTDPRQAARIASLPLRTGRDRKAHSAKAVGKASAACARTARTLMPDSPPDTQRRTQLDLTDGKTARLVSRGLDRLAVPHTTEDGDGTVRIGFDEAYAPAVDAWIAGMMQRTDAIDQSAVDGWPEFRAAARHILDASRPSTASRPARPLEPDWAGRIAARLNAIILDRRNGSVRDDWIGGVVPPVRAHDRGVELDLVRQNESLIAQATDRLADQAMSDTRPWARQVHALADRDPLLPRDVAVYRAMWGQDDDESPLGPRPGASSGRQEQHWCNLAGRLAGHGPDTVLPAKDGGRNRRDASTASTDGVAAEEREGMRGMPPRTVPDGETAQTSASPSI